VLLVDEPVNGLDPEGIRWLRDLMKGLAGEGRTVFVSSHLMSEMALTADHLVVIGAGRLLADTSMAEFIRANSHAYVLVRTPEPERVRDVLADAGLTARTAADGALHIDGDATAVGALIAAHGLLVHEVGTHQASLEEAFIRLVGTL
jgi:ABC-2 type transport system ATP-binding protein